MLVFGTAKNFPQAVFGRLMGGLLSGNTGVLKSVISEITDDTNRSKAFSLMSLSWSLGTTIAPLAGGLLSNPVDKYPFLFRQGGVFHEYPYLLPCLFCSVFLLCSTLLCAFGLKESRVFAPPSSSSSSSLTSVKLSSSPSKINVKKVKTLKTISSDSLSTASLSPSPSSTSSPCHLSMTDDEEVSILFDSNNDNDDNNGEVSGHDEKQTFIEMKTLKTAKNKNNFSNKRGGSNHEEEKIDGETEEVEADVDDRMVLLSAKQRENNDHLKKLSRESVRDNETESAATMLSTIVKQREEKREEMEVKVEAEEDDDDNDDEIECFWCSCSSSNNNNNSGSRGPDALVGSVAVAVAVAESRMKRRSGQDSGGVYTRANMGDSDDAELDFDLERGDTDTDIDIETAATFNESTIGSSKNSNNNSNSESKSESKVARKKNVLRQRVVLLVTINYGILAMAFILLDETIPLFLKQDIRQGGFSFSSMNIGLLLSVCGGGMLVFSGFVLPVVSTMSKVKMFRYGVYVAVGHVLLWPLLATFTVHLHTLFSPSTVELMIWPLLISLGIVKGIAAIVAFTAIGLQINHAVRNEHLGIVNGFAQSLAALARSIGPACGGVLWGISTASGFVYLNFLFVFGLWILNLFLARYVPMSIDFKRKERKIVVVSNESSCDGKQSVIEVDSDDEDIQFSH